MFDYSLKKYIKIYMFLERENFEGLCLKNDVGELHGAQQKQASRRGGEFEVKEVLRTLLKEWNNQYVSHTQ